MLKKNAGQVSEELRLIYAKAWKEGIFLLEIKGEEGAMAGAGSVKDLKEIRKTLKTKISINDLIKRLSFGDCVNLTMPGTGPTREEACRNAVKAYKEFWKKKKQKTR